MSDQDFVLEAPPDDEAAPPGPPPAPQPPEPTEGPLDPPEAETPEGEPPPEKPKRSLVSDLQSERQARRDAEQKAQTYQQQLAQSQPILQALARHPNGVQILQSLVQGQPLPAPGPPQPDPEAQSVAEDLGLYNVDGTPDLVKAGRVLQRQRSVAERAVQAAVAPIQQGTVQQQAQHSREQLWQQAHRPENAHVDPHALRELLQALPDDIIAHQEVQSLVWVLAAGATALQGGRQATQTPAAPPTAPPTFTEQAGGRTRAAPQLAPTFQNILKRAGLSEKDVQTTLSKFNPNGPNALE